MVKLNTQSLRMLPESNNARSTTAARVCRRKFLQYFPGGFKDQEYLDSERDYKAAAHDRWQEVLNPAAFRTLLRNKRYSEIASAAINIESRTNLLFSFEKMALRDAVKSPAGAKAFAEGLYDFLHGSGSDKQRFERWVEVVASLPRKQTRVLTWPIVTVFGFIAQPRKHIFLKPRVTTMAAQAYGFDFDYESRPDWATYQKLLRFAREVAEDNRDLHPRDMIDLQSFIWVQGSDEYPA
ncbi:MAG: hypothetical protein ACJ8C4_01120 [Gemmataceae bacterium]